MTLAVICEVLRGEKYLSYLDFRERHDQEVPDVPRADRAGRGLRADDVQTVQTRLLLVLPHLPRCKLTFLDFPLIGRTLITLRLYCTLVGMVGSAVYF